MADFDRESMLEMFTFEMSQLLEQLEQQIIAGEAGYDMNQINEIFRIMHTIKGSAAMMMFTSISTTAHAIEDLFYYLREENPTDIDFSTLTDIVLEAMDFIKMELGKIESGDEADGDGSEFIKTIKSFLAEIKGEEPPSDAPAAAAAAPTPAPAAAAPKKPMAEGMNRYKVHIRFDEGCEMENVRAYTMVYKLEETMVNLSYIPDDVIDESSIEIIRRDGFTFFGETTMTKDELKESLADTIYLKSIEVSEADMAEVPVEEAPVESQVPQLEKGDTCNYKITLMFDKGAEMENVRALTAIGHLRSYAKVLSHTPEYLEDETSIPTIKHNGCSIVAETDLSEDGIREVFSQTLYLDTLTIERLAANSNAIPEGTPAPAVAPAPVAAAAPVAAPTPQAKPATPGKPAEAATGGAKKAPGQHVISVNVSKLDQLLNLMGELVISEAMVTQNPEIESLELESFHKEARQLRKIIKDVQDTVMSMRMVPLQATFFKMHRIVRDMCKQLKKDVELEIVGETTEVDKNIIEHISDPLMHIIRNSIDHGIEMPDDRMRLGKPEKGTVLLEAKNTGGDVLIIVKDNGAGLKKEKIMAKAKSNELLKKPENEYTDKEVYQFIFLPGFSTNDQVTNFSGRGVGMDVVTTNLEIVGGSVLVDSNIGEGSVFTLKIPLTLAIIEGMIIKMGGAKYTIPIISIQQSFKAHAKDLFMDPNGNEMITVRNEVYNVIRLYEFFNVETEIREPEDGIMIMLENGDQTIVIMADELVGEQQVVVKAMPKYIKKINGISGCTLLGNGDISLIIEVTGFFDR